MDFINLYIVVGMWAAQIFYLLSFFPQIAKNYQQKSGTGVSDLFLLGYLNGYITFLCYAFLLGLPFVYKLLPSIAAGAVVILIAQRLYYDRSPVGKRFAWIYLGNIAAGILIIPLFKVNPLLIGSVGGWVNIAITMLGQIPQIWYIHRNKSVAGFSFMFVVMMGTAGFFEFSTAYLAQLPIQTIVSAFRNMLVVAFFMFQFYIYRNID